MDKVSDAQFKDYASANAIKTMKVVRISDGFVVVVNLTWKEGDYTIYTQRNKPRSWQSIDRLIAHLDRTAPNVRNFEVFLTTGMNDEIFKRS